MSINYAERFERQIEQQFARELTSANIATNNRYNFIDAQTIKVPTIQLSGYKDHARDGTKNRGTVGNTYQAFTLTHDRDIEFFVDEMDVDETNQVLSAANITAVFNEEQAIPETDAFRYSKLYSEFVDLGGTVNTTELSSNNILFVFDKMMEDMDEAGVPQSGRILKVTPTVYTMLKNAEGLQRTLDVTGGAKGINRNVRSLDEVTIDTVPSDRMKTAYDFTTGFTPAATADQINMILCHPSAILAPMKVADIYLWNKGQTPDSAFGYLYQNRMYTDLFIIEAKIGAVAINANLSGSEPEPLADLTFECAEGSTAGTTKISTVTPTKNEGNSYVYKINGILPILGEDLSEKGWAAYTLGTDIVVNEGNTITLVEVDNENKAVAGGSALAVVKVVVAAE
jgi:hypothetical protein